MSTNEEREIQNLVNELSKDMARRENLEKTAKKAARFSVIFTFGFLFILLISFVAYLSYHLTNAKEEIKQKQSTIDGMEQTISSLMYNEQLREEEALKTIPGEDTNLTDDIEKNIDLIREFSNGTKGENVSRGNQNFPEIALTFDLASGDYLEYVYRLMQEHPIKITIFISNERASDSNGSLFDKSNRNMLKKFASLGNRVEFGNHTWSHFNFVRSITEISNKKRKFLEYISDKPLSYEAMDNEMERANSFFKSLTGRTLERYYRLPYGSVNQLVMDALASLGYQKHIMWSMNQKGSLDIPDYIFKPYISKKDPSSKKNVKIKNPYFKTSEETLEFLDVWEKKDPKGMNGAIILMHLGSPRKSDELIYVLDTYIPQMLKKGYRFTTVNEVLNNKLD